MPLKKIFKFKIVSQVYCEVENLNRVFKFVIEIFFRNGDKRIIGDRYDAVTAVNTAFLLIHRVSSVT